MSSRLVTPGLSSAARTASGPVSLSVTARAIFRRTTSGGSSSRTAPAGSPDLLILRVGSARSRHPGTRRWGGDLRDA